MKLIKEIYSYREMITSLVRKELRGRYKGSVLGFFWTFLNPLLQLLVYNIVFAVILQNGIDKYYLFLFVGLVPWFFFNSCITAGSTCIIGQKSLVTKIYFPREVIPISHTITNFVNMLLSFIIIFIIVAIAQVGISFEALLFLPLVMAVEFVMCMGVTFIVSAVTVYFRDMEHILGIISMAWMYLTPVMYSETMIPEKVRFLFRLNPMSSVIQSYRDILYYKQIPDVLVLLESLAFGVVILGVGVFVFTHLKKRFAEEL